MPRFFLFYSTKKNLQRNQHKLSTLYFPPTRKAEYHLPFPNRLFHELRAQFAAELLGYLLSKKLNFSIIFDLN